MPGTVSISLESNGKPESFYADRIEYYTISNNMGYEGDSDRALIPESFRKDILKEKKDKNKVLIENSNTETANFALLFEFMETRIKFVTFCITAFQQDRLLKEKQTKKQEKYNHRP